MDDLFTNPPVLVSFRHIYDQNIVPKLQEIDLFLKTTDAPYPVQRVAELLGVTKEVVVSIMSKLDMTSLNKLAFFNIVVECSSYICGLIKRQWKYVGTAFYTPQMIAYIYELNEKKVQDAFERLGIDCIHESHLLDVFSEIPTPIFYF